MRSQADHLAEIGADGYTIVHDVFDAERARSLIDELDRLEHELGIVPADNSFEGVSTLRIYNLLTRGPLFEQIAVDETVLPIVDGVLSDECLVSSLSSIVICPGEQSQPIHADDQAMPLGKPHVPTVCNTMWALTDFTEANGATRIIPGSHLADHSPTFGQHYDSIPAEMPAGSVLVWHGSLWHGGGANRTDERRYGIATNYCAGWIRQQENQQLGVPLDLIRSFPPRLQRLCGFGTYRSIIGHIDKRTASEVLLGGDEHAHLWDHT
jgi:ectoine hydroxylase-related dioxygenase (phytanoyl-CoA dioxygenase family)